MIRIMVLLTMVITLIIILMMILMILMIALLNVGIIIVILLQELPPDPATSLTSSPPTKELQSSTVSSVILEPMDRDGNVTVIKHRHHQIPLELSKLTILVAQAMERDSLSNIIVDPMDRVVLGSRSPGNIDMKVLLSGQSPSSL